MASDTVPTQPRAADMAADMDERTSDREPAAPWAGMAFFWTAWQVEQVYSTEPGVSSVASTRPVST